jgi:hypothetical protein
MMNPTARDARSTLPSILTTYQPIEDFWTAFPRIDGQGRTLEQVLPPLDAFLTRLVLDFIPGLPAFVDAAAESTLGTSCLVGLNHPQVRRVTAVLGTTEGTSESLATLRIHLRSRPAGDPPFDIAARPDLVEVLARETPVVVLADARLGAADDLIKDLGVWLDAAPDALVLILGLGRVGHCPAIDALIRHCGSDSGHRLSLMRELDEAFVASGLAVIARAGHPLLEDILHRIQTRFATNYGYVDLLKSLNQLSMRATDVDYEAFSVHPSFSPLREEIAAIRRAHRESSEALALATAQLDGRRSSEVARGPSLLKRIRRELTPPIAGKLYRMAKRAAGKARASIGALE